MAKDADKKVSARKAVKTTEPKKAKPAAPATAIASTFFIDCKLPIGKKLMKLEDIEKFIIAKFKPTKESTAADNKDKLIVTQMKDGKLKIEAIEPLAKRYVKYLAKCFIRKAGITQSVKTISMGKDTYKLDLISKEEEIPAKK
eukprot:gnl/Chilomastix_caulleri/2572.p1 GENE.gnl/Chilomastix_caulleri/2572~~gnl/Chilomastix_caulleri/2572.p1  ORF type:complete len:143 (+),score=47.01 gnl/Chilomastix_caulleri/2572:78-506(+)